MKYAAHPYADLFPLMGDAELRQLADDIAANGQREPIYLVGELILDGRNRFRACELARVKPRFEQYAGDDLLGFVVSKNLHRRHMNESQRAMVADKLANMEWGSNRHGAKLEASIDASSPPPVTQREAAEMLNVGRRIVQKARKVSNDGAEGLADLVNAGEVSVEAAATVADLPHDEQAEVIEKGPAAVKAKAAEVKKQKPAARPAAAEPENKAKPKKLRGVGVITANEALNVLHRIPADDPELGQAVNIITAWVNRQKGRLPRN
jgi:hypothetical protein